MGCSKLKTIMIYESSGSQILAGSGIKWGIVTTRIVGAGTLSHCSSVFSDGANIIITWPSGMIPPSEISHVFRAMLNCQAVSEQKLWKLKIREINSSFQPSKTLTLMMSDSYWAELIGIGMGGVAVAVEKIEHFNTDIYCYSFHTVWDRDRNWDWEWVLQKGMAGRQEPPNAFDHYLEILNIKKRSDLYEISITNSLIKWGKNWLYILCE